MNRTLQLLRFLLIAGAFLVAGSIDATAQRRDSLQVFQTNGEANESCFDFILYSHQPNGIKISELRMRILSDSATFIAGQGAVETPPNWDVFLNNNLKEISWVSGDPSSDLDSGESLGGFRVCARGPGLIRIVWETRNIDGTLQRDTIVRPLGGRFCDEAYFRSIPSSVEAVFDVDLINGNGRSAINTFILQNLTPGVTFDTSGARLPLGWRISRANADTLVFSTTNSPIAQGWFAEGFRIRVNVPRDSVFRLEYWTRQFGNEQCRDTATLVWRGLAVRDTVQIFRLPDGCCDDIVLRNTHQPSTTIDIFSIRAITPGVTISSVPTFPLGWTRLGPATVTDSVAFGRTPSLTFSDTTLFSGICFDNSQATSDTVRFRYRTIGNGVVISEGIGQQICLRPLTRCDSVTVRVDSTYPSPTRCITITVTNRNSREATIERILFKIANPGVRRRILSSTAPANFIVEATGTDTILFRGVLPAGLSRSFVLCLSNTDAGVLDPLTITYQTYAANRVPLCAGNLTVNAVIERLCDNVTATQTTSSDPNIACFTATIANRNDQNRAIDGVQFSVVNPLTIFSSATAPAGFQVTTPAFPDITVGYGGGTIAAGASLENFVFCIDRSQISSDPTTIPVVWRTFSNGQIVCSDTLRLVARRDNTVECDSIRLNSSLSIGGEICESKIQVINEALPAGQLDTVLFRISDTRAKFITAGATGWSLIALGRDSALFAGGNLPSGGSSEFTLRLDSVTPGMTITTITRRATQAACTTELVTDCRTTSVPLPGLAAPELLEMTPNPFSESTAIRYLLRSRGEVELIVNDGRGVEVARIDRGIEEQGEHLFQFDGSSLPSGIYYLTVKSGSTTRVGRLVLVR